MTFHAVGYCTLPKRRRAAIADLGSLRPLDTFCDVSRAAASRGLEAGQPELWTATIK